MARFVWDPGKARINELKHGVSFALAEQVFSDPFALMNQDRIEQEEYRWQTLGMVEGLLLLLVAHTYTDDDGDEVIRIISARRADRREENYMKALSRKPAVGASLSAAQRKKVRQLASLPDSEIDYSDIAPLTQEFAKNAIRNPLYRPIKHQLTVRLDADVVAWLRKKGKGYQTRINLVLRNAMTQDVLKGRTRSK